MVVSRLVVTVIVPVRDRAEDLRRCLQALAEQDLPRGSFEVIVCDDGSTEDLTPALQPLRDRDISVNVLTQDRRGPASARNLGIRHASAPLVAMTDSDTIPQRAWLRNLVEALDQNPLAAGAEGKVYADNAGEFGPLGEGPTNLSGGVYLTCNCAYRLAALQAAGGFDETFPFPACEDTDLAACVLLFGPVLWVPDAVVIHPERPLSARTVVRKLRFWEFVLRMGYRYGYLGWKEYPVEHPGLRVIALAVVALPLTKLKRAFAWLGREPRASVKLVGLALLESLGAIVVVVPKVLFGRPRPKAGRRRYLDDSAGLRSREAVSE